jgi:hypothetical protein
MWWPSSSTGALPFLLSLNYCNTCTSGALSTRSTRRSWRASAASCCAPSPSSWRRCVPLLLSLKPCVCPCSSLSNPVCAPAPLCQTLFPFFPANFTPQSERARRIVSSGALNGSASAASDSGVQRSLSSPVPDAVPVQSAPSPTPVSAPDLSKRVRFQDSPPAASEASAAAAAAPAAAVVVRPVPVPISSLTARAPRHPHQAQPPPDAQPAPLRRAPAGAPLASQPPNAAHVAAPPPPHLFLSLFNPPPTPPPPATPSSHMTMNQDAAGDAADSHATLRLDAIALSGPGRLERLRGRTTGERPQAVRACVRACAGEGRGGEGRGEVRLSLAAGHAVPQCQRAMFSAAAAATGALK